MANDITHNPWIIDTAEPVSSKRLTLAKVIWRGPTTAGHALIIHNLAGEIILSVLEATGGANVVQQYDLPDVVCAGIDIDTLGSGIAYLYFREQGPSVS